MALLWADGFRYGGASKYEAISGDASVASDAGRTNGVDSYGLRTSASFRGYVEKRIPARDDLRQGFWVYLDPLRTGNYVLLQLLDNTVTHLTMELNFSTFIITVKRGDGTVLGTSTVAATANGEGLYLELGSSVSDSTGQIEVRSWGSPILTLSGLDTRNGGTATFTRLRLGQFTSSNQAVRFDDWYVCDTLGTTNNDFLATTTHTPRVIDLEPSAAGDVTAWAATGAGGVNWDAVADGSAPDNDTSYVAASGIGARDLYRLTDLPAGVSSIKGLVQWGIWRKDDATVREAALALRSGATDSDDAGVGLTTSYLPYSRVLESDPNTGAAWSEAAVNALQAGVKVAA